LWLHSCKPAIRASRIAAGVSDANPPADKHVKGDSAEERLAVLVDLQTLSCPVSPFQIEKFGLLHGITVFSRLISVTAQPGLHGKGCHNGN
jgi:hypothetical protein